jgi:hypothetical protein
VIAQRLQQSKREVPHYYLTSEIRMDAVLALREEFNSQGGPAPHGAPVFLQGTCCFPGPPFMSFGGIPLLPNRQGRLQTLC